MGTTFCLDFSHCQATMTSNHITGLAVFHYLEGELKIDKGLKLKDRSHNFKIFPVLTINTPFQMMQHFKVKQFCNAVVSDESTQKKDLKEHSRHL